MRSIFIEHYITNLYNKIDISHYLNNFLIRMRFYVSNFGVRMVRSISKLYLINMYARK